MAKKKSSSSDKPNRTGKSALGLFIPDDLRAALDACVERNRRDITKEVIIALEKYLGEQGLWPLKDK